MWWCNLPSFHYRLYLFRGLWGLRNTIWWTHFVTLPLLLLQHLGGCSNCCVCVPQDQLAIYESCGKYKGMCLLLLILFAHLVLLCIESERDHTLDTVAHPHSLTRTIRIINECRATAGTLAPGCQWTSCDCCGYCVTTRAVSSRKCKVQPVPCSFAASRDYLANSASSYYRRYPRMPRPGMISQNRHRVTAITLIFPTTLRV